MQVASTSVFANARTIRWFITICNYVYEGDFYELFKSNTAN